MATRSTNTRSTVVAAFHEREHARDAIDDLKRAGFKDDQIGYTARHMDASGRAVEPAGDAAGGALAGAATGGVLGGILGAAASLLIPGVGPVVAAGFLGPILGGAAAGAAIGAAGGGIIGALMNAGVPEEEARYYDTEFRAGRHIVTVKAGARAQEAHDILSRHRASFYGATAGTAATARSAMDTTATRTMKDEGTVRVPEVEERLEVGKRPVEKGQVTIRKEVEEKRETVPVNLRQEEVHVEKRDVADRPLKPGEDAFKEGTIRVPVHGEEAVARKEAVVTGEVVVKKDVHTERETVADTVRKTEVHVDKDRETVRPAGQEVVHAGKTGTTYNWNEYSPRFRTHWEQNYRSSGMRYEAYEPAYRFGWDMAGNERYRGRQWGDVESDFRRDWESRYHDKPWDRFADAIRHGWNSLTGADVRR
jgi:uncharacterized protein (TIGR02271 family)